jgi:hypothetical protein
MRVNVSRRMMRRREAGSRARYFNVPVRPTSKQPQIDATGRANCAS